MKGNRAGVGEGERERERERKKWRDSEVNEERKCVRACVSVCKGRSQNYWTDIGQ